MAKNKVVMATPEQQAEIKNLLQSVIGDEFFSGLLNQNVYTDPMNSEEFRTERNITWNVTNIMNIERAEPIFRRILNYKASMPLKGIDINSKNIDSEKLEQIQIELDKLYYPLYEMIYQGECFGGSACLICIKGQTTDDNGRHLKEPLDFSTIKKGDFLGLKTLERWFSCVPTIKLVDTIGGETGIEDPMEIGEPLYYKVRIGGQNTREYTVHRSRLVFYNTGILPNIEKRIEQYWGVSLLERIYRPLVLYKTIVNATSDMTLISSQRVVKMEEIDTDVSQLTQRAYDAMKNKLALMKRMLNYSNVLFLGANDSFDYKNVTLNGIGEVVKNAERYLATCSGVPMSYLFNDGINDQQTTENAYAEIKTVQNVFMDKIYKKLIKIIYRSLFGEDIPTFQISFIKLREVSDKDMADIINKIVSSLVDIYKVNGMDKKTFVSALSEITQNLGDMFSNYSDDFIKKFGDKLYVEEQIELSHALNGNKNENTEVAKENNGGINNEPKPTPNVPVVGGKNEK